MIRHSHRAMAPALAQERPLYPDQPGYTSRETTQEHSPAYAYDVDCYCPDGPPGSEPGWASNPSRRLLGVQILMTDEQTTVKVSGEAIWRAEQEQRVIQLAVAAERERCAKIADRYANCAAIKSKFDDGYTSAAKDIADEIRSA